MVRTKEKRVERRKYIRLDIETKVNYKLSDTQQSKEPALCKNLSAEGICLSLGQKFEPQTVLELELWLPEEKTWAHMKGEVVWSKAASASQDRSRKVFNTGIKVIYVDPQDESEFLIWICDRMIDKFGQFLKL